MNDETTCFICFEDNVDTVLTCCNKKIHGSCVKQWWRTNNISLNDAICPHCRQRCILDKYQCPQVLNLNNIPELPLPMLPTDSVHPTIPNIYLTSTLMMYTNPVSNNYSRRNRIFPDQGLIVYNNIYNLTDNEIHLINSNRNNTIPNNAFSHQMINDNTTHDFISCSKLVLSLIIMVGIIITVVVLN